ncbi:plasma membrane iron permease [Lecanosticta acicola]|uniref:Plasma membrane iron permease n=1 Tax=Lecanosticta acicola TaxID=111012 RepID=A0AAI8YTL9_9PEZI|nr:plasma membrane iron permease [Lecanosticta acicola]
MVNVFAVPVFFICFRECLECTIIVSILLAFLKQSIGGPDRDKDVYKKLLKQIWLGVGLGVAICLVIGGAFIGTFYGLGKDIYGNSEDIWEGAFSLIASIIITLMGIGLLRVSKLQDKWRVKIAQALEGRHTGKGLALSARFRIWAEKYAMFWLPFITVLREGLEAVVFIGGVGLGLPATSFPLAVICGLLAGVVIGYLIYRGGNTTKLQIFLTISTCFLYLISAGLFSKAVWYFQNYHWTQLTGGDASETGSGAGSYDIRQSVWHVNCCNPELNGGGGWGIFNSILGWENSATYGSVISYNLYWLVVIIAFAVLGFYEKRGHWPFMKAKPQTPSDDEEAADSDQTSRDDEKKGAVEVNAARADSGEIVA